MRPLPLLALLTALVGCGAPDEVDALHAFVRRSGPTADTLTVGRADTLRARVDAQVLSGAVAWALVAPNGREAWAGVAGPADTVATFAAASPSRGDWRLVLAPDSAVGVVELRASAR